MKHRKLFVAGGIVLSAAVMVELTLFFFTGAFGRTAVGTLMNTERGACGMHTAYYMSSRGRILDCKGRVIATHATLWDLHLDCTVLDVPDSEWDSLARGLSVRLEEILGGKTADEYFDMLRAGRTGHKRYLKICEHVADSLATSLMRAPILNMGRFKGGEIFTPHDARSHPYGGLGLQTIGYPHPECPTGIEGAYDYLLRGDTCTLEYVVRLRRGKYVSKVKSRIDAEDGQDVKTTLDMDMMSVCDSALRESLRGSRDVKSACVVLTEVKGGAVRGMVNLVSVPDREGCFEELKNIAVDSQYEPGGVLSWLPMDVLGKGLEKMEFDFSGLMEACVRTLGDDERIDVFCPPLYVSRIFGGIANDGTMYNPYLVTPSSSVTLCSPAVADSLKSLLKGGCVSTVPVGHTCAEGEDPYRYPSGEREYATTWAGLFTADGVEYALVVVAFSDRTMLNAPQKNVPEKAAKGIME